jgi:hypothetical protein
MGSGKVEDLLANRCHKRYPHICVITYKRNPDRRVADLSQLSESPCCAVKAELLHMIT